MSDGIAMPDAESNPAGTLSLAVLQAGATQFDGPFFRFLQQQDKLQLTVYYTDSAHATRPYDPELSHRSGWGDEMVSGYSYYVYPRSFAGRIKMSHSLVRKRPDLIIVSGWRCLDNLVVILFALASGIPLGLRSDNHISVTSAGSPKRLLKTFVLKQCFKMFSTGHPVGTLAEEYMLANGIDPAKIFPFPYLVNVEMLTSLTESAMSNRHLLRSRYGICPSDMVILGVMKFIDREDPMTLLRAFASLDDGPIKSSARDVNSGGRTDPASQEGSTFPEVHLLLVGDGHLRPAIEQYVQEEHVLHVHLPGYVPYTSLPEFFAIADVLVHPAVRESWGVTVNEAIACSLPVVAADTVGSSVDLIDVGLTGFTFPAGDSRALGALLRALRSQPALLASLKTRCNKAKGLTRFSYATALANLVNALRATSLKTESRKGPTS